MISIIQVMMEIQSDDQTSDGSTVKGRATKVGITGGLIGSEIGLGKGQKHFSNKADQYGENTKNLSKARIALKHKSGGEVEPGTGNISKAVKYDKDGTASKYINKLAKSSQEDSVSAQNTSDTLKSLRPTHVLGSTLKKTGKAIFGGDDD